jgi:hypothetical protein
MEYAFMAGGSDACASIRLTRYKQGESPRKNRANCRGIEKLEALHTRGHDAVDRPSPPDQKSSKSQSQKASETHENTFCVKKWSRRSRTDPRGYHVYPHAKFYSGSNVPVSGRRRNLRMPGDPGETFRAFVPVRAELV